MPYKSSEQAAFFKMCEENPELANEECPPESVLRSYRQLAARTKGRMEGIKKQIKRSKARSS